MTTLKNTRKSIAHGLRRYTRQCRRVGTRRQKRTTRRPKLPHNTFPPSAAASELVNQYVKHRICKNGCNLGNILCAQAIRALMRDTSQFKNDYNFELDSLMMVLQRDPTRCCNLPHVFFPKGCFAKFNSFAKKLNTTTQPDALQGKTNLLFVVDSWEYPNHTAAGKQLKFAEYITFWKAVAPYLRSWYYKSIGQTGPVRLGTMGERFLTTKAKMTTPHFVLYFRCSDTPFVRHETYTLFGKTFIQRCVARYKQKYAHAEFHLQTGSCMYKKRKNNNQNERTHACCAYANWVTGICKAEGVNVRIISGTMESDFANLVTAKEVWSSPSSFVLVARLCGHGVNATPDEKGKAWFGMHMPVHTEKLKHHKVKDYFDTTSVIRQLDHL